MEADHIVSTIGYVETMKLCGNAADAPLQPGKLSFCEAIAVFREEPRDLGWKDTIIFFEERERFHYHQPQDLLDHSAGVICIPNNYNYGLDRKLPEGIIRISQLANATQWKTLLVNDCKRYLRVKQEEARILFEKAKGLLQSLSSSSQSSALHLLDIDCFTPHTVERFTGHINGSIYGTPRKIFDGKLPFDKLYLCGTDQGYLGIIGSMMSGVAIANRHILPS
jgi:phytoene dehydrogenase-like protein